MQILSRYSPNTKADASAPNDNPKKLAARLNAQLANFFICKEVTLGRLELPGVPLTLRGSLERLSLQMPVFPVYPRKGPCVHVSPSYFYGSGGSLYEKKNPIFCPLGTF